MEEKTTIYETAYKPNSHPYQNANILSTFFYIWMIPLFKRGINKDLGQEDLLPPLKAHDAHYLGDKLELSWKYQLENNQIPSLWKALWRVHRKDFIFTGCLWILSETFIKTAQPICVSKLMAYYTVNSTMTQEEVLIYAGLIPLMAFLQVIFSHYYLLHILQLALKIRMSTSSLIYRKALKLSGAALAETTIGQMVNLLSNDVSRFDSATVQFHCLWYCPIQAVIVMVLCYIYLGPTAMTGVVLLMSLIPFQMWMAKRVSLFRHRTASRTDERIRLMNEIISGIQVIKMYTWEKPFAQLVELSRRKELVEIRNMSFIKAIIGSFNVFLSRCAICICITTFVLTGNVPTAQYVYTLTTFYTLFHYAITILFPQGITQYAEVSITMKRLHKFLLLEEVANKSPLTEQVTIDKQIGLNIQEASAKWSAESENVLNNINMEIKAQDTIAIVGPVGSGKSTLLHLIMKEIPLTKGQLNVNGRISYASQEAWIFAGSIRQNILFGQQYVAKKYQEVVKVCALERDFSLFPFGDETIAGERGVMLSGGQKARINLARAVYKDADIYLLDDPLSAVDTHVGRHIFDECILRYLKDKAVILVTHQLQYVNNTDKIYVLGNGCVQASGSYEELLKSDKEFTKLLNELKAEQKEVEGNPIDGGDKDKNKENVHENKPKVLQENRSIGNVSWGVYKSYISSGGHWCKILMLIMGFVLSQTACSLGDYFQSFWVNLEQDRTTNSNEQNFNYTAPTNSSSMDTSNYETILQNKFFTQENCLYIYITLVALTVTLTLSRSFAFYKFCIKASLRLHNSMFGKIVYATMRFFHLNSSGRILNRFSSDMGSIDEQLPLIFLETIQIAFIVGASLIIIGILNPWMFVPTVIIFVIFYFLRIVYLRTSRDVKRLESTTRSPIYSHLNASLQGLTTIRAFDAQKILQQEFDNFQNINGSAWFTFVGCARTFGFWLDLHCVAYISLVTFGFLLLQTEMLGGNIGLAITQALSLTGMFQYGIRQWSELENRMTCVERVKEYADVNPESDQGKIEPPQQWPEKGKITFEKLCLKYDDNEQYILNDLSFSVGSGEKVGIVGRTGAGKSSIVAAIFRLAHTDGKIKIDDVDTKLVSLNKLRSSISIIPQEPVLFCGSLRKNLDPFDVYSDKVLWSALEEVELKQVVSDLPHGLETPMSEGGSNFSVGQRQLVCLARAIVGNNKILIMDEATANVDPQTDALIQTTIREKFSDCTVLTIAHRLHTIMDSDKVLVMDNGRAVEFGHPHELLEIKRGEFWGLVEQTGKTTMKSLSDLAEKSYRERSGQII